MQEKTFLQQAMKIVPISLGLVAIFWFGSAALGLSSAVQQRLCGIVLVIASAVMAGLGVSLLGRPAVVSFAGSGISACAHSAKW